MHLREEKMTMDDPTHQRRPILREFRTRLIFVGIACYIPDLIVAIMSIECYFCGQYKPHNALLFLALCYIISQFGAALFFSFQTFNLKRHIAEYFKSRRMINPQAVEDQGHKIGRLMFWLQTGSLFMVLNGFVRIIAGLVVFDPSLMSASLNTAYFSLYFSGSLCRILVSVVQINAVRPIQESSLAYVAYRASVKMLRSSRRARVQNVPSRPSSLSESTSFSFQMPGQHPNRLPPAQSHSASGTSLSTSSAATTTALLPAGGQDVLLLVFISIAVACFLLFFIGT